MRGAWVVCILLLGMPPASAQASDPGLVAAVAPAQTVIEAAASVVALSLQEAHRDGTPDKAEALLVEIGDFVQGIDIKQRIAPSATYAQEARDALAYSHTVHEALADFPDAAADVSVVAFGCDVGVVPEEQRDQLFLGLARLESLRLYIEDIAAAAPKGVDGTPLLKEAEKIDPWIARYEIDTRCKFTADPFLILDVVPSVTWPTGHIRIVGATNVANDTRLTSAPLALDANVTVFGGRFGLEWTVPENAPLGRASVHGVAGALEADANFTIDKADSTLIILGEGEQKPGASFALDVRLLSPLRERVANATIHVTGADTREIRLEQGGARATFTAPTTPGRYVLTFAYDGDTLVRGAKEDFAIVVVSPQVVPPTPESAPTPPRTPLAPLIGLPTALQSALKEAAVPLLILLILLILALIAAALIRALRALRALRARARAQPAAQQQRAAAGFDSVTSLDLASTFAAILTWLRSRGRVPRSATAREAAESMRTWGADPGAIVYAFERVRYGDGEANHWAFERMRAWAVNAWSRIRGPA